MRDNEMSLDIHLASSKTKAEHLYPELSFDEEIHEFLFGDRNKWIEKYLLFAKMNDYYSDTFYIVEDIAELKHEVNEIVLKVKDQQSIKFLDKFIKLCDQALDKNENIYCFCD